MTRAQLLQVGMSAEAIKSRIKVRRLVVVHRGVYALGHAPRAFQDRAYAAVLACSPDGVLSHGSAGSLWGIVDGWGMPFEVIVDTARRRPGICMHRAILASCDVRRHLGIRVTSPARTVFDIATRLTDTALTRAVNDLRIARRLKLDQLGELVARLPRHPGASRVRALIETPNGPSRSELEDIFGAFGVRFDLPPFEFNARVAGYEVDVLFPQQRVIVELDGYEFHRTREAFERDRERDAVLLAAGFVVIRITWQRLTQAPEKEAERLWAILAARS